MANVVMDIKDVNEADSSGGEEQRKAIARVPRASASLTFDGQDAAIKDANQVLVRDLGQVDLSSTLQKADALFTSIMDPNNEDTRKLVRDLFYEPMKVINDKAMQAIQAIDVENPERGSEQIMLVTEILEASAKVRETTLDHVYDNMNRQIDHFSTSVDAYNAKMKDTIVQALDLYQQRIDTEIVVRTKVLKQKREESAAMLEVSMQETEVRAASMRLSDEAQQDINQRKLEAQRKKDELEHQKELQNIERARKKAEQELETQRKKDEQEQKKAEAEEVRAQRKAELELDKQRKKDEQEQKKAEAEFDRMKKKDEAEHAKLMKELERKAKSNMLDRDSNIMKQYELEVSRYNAEFEMAREAMKQTIGRRFQRCQIQNTPPKIEWTDPPRVVPGSVTWTAS